MSYSLLLCCLITKCSTLCDPVNCSALGFPVLHYLPKFAQTQVHLVSHAIQPSLPLSSPSPLALSLSQHQGLFRWVSSVHQVSKVLELQHQSFQCSGLISFRIDWLDLLAVQGTLKNLLQHHNLKASVLQCSLLYGPTLTCWSRLVGLHVMVLASGMRGPSFRSQTSPQDERLLLSRERLRDSWPLEEKNSIRGQWRSLITQNFCVIKFY